MSEDTYTPTLGTYILTHSTKYSKGGSKTIVIQHSSCSSYLLIYRSNIDAVVDV